MFQFLFPSRREFRAYGRYAGDDATKKTTTWNSSPKGCGLSSVFLFVAAAAKRTARQGGSPLRFAYRFARYMCTLCSPQNSRISNPYKQGEVPSANVKVASLRLLSVRTMHHYLRMSRRVNIYKRKLTFYLFLYFPLLVFFSQQLITGPTARTSDLKPLELQINPRAFMCRA